VCNFRQSWSFASSVLKKVQEVADNAIESSAEVCELRVPQLLAGREQEEGALYSRYFCS
jgi:hypothetical protein